MNIAIDISPLSNPRLLKHRVRGTGFYIENLKNSLVRYFPKNRYQLIQKDKQVSGKIDLVHYPYFEPFFLSLPNKKQYKTVVTVHDLTPLVFPKQFPVGLKGKIKWQVQKQKLKKVDAIITDSNSSKRDIVKLTGIDPSKIHVVYLAAGEEFKRTNLKSDFTEKVRKKYGLPKTFVLYVGDGTWNKNLPSLIQAVQRIDIDIVMVGKALKDENFDRSNPWNQDLTIVQNSAKEDKKIHLLGFVETKELVSLYQMATVFAMPSLYEGFGLPVLEAMSCGCPVVISNGGSLPEVGGGAALYVDANDVESVANGIRELFSNKTLQEELSQKGMKHAREFSWKKTAAETMEVYEKAIS